MALVSVTRVRVARRRHLLPSYLDTFRSLRQARRAPGYLAGSLLSGADRTLWTLTVWRSEADMRAYRNAGARAAMPKLMRWCDEAALTHWQQEGDALPAWSGAEARLRADPGWTRLPAPSERQRAGHIPSIRGRGMPPRGPKR